MTFLEMAGEILPVIGTVGLLGLWLYQQKQIDKYANELRKINLSRNVYQTYQSNNAIFDALEAMSSKNKETSDKIRSLQIYNYETGLSEIENTLNRSEKRGLPPSKVEFFETKNGIEEAFKATQKRLEVLQTRLNQKEKKIKLF